MINIVEAEHAITDADLERVEKAIGGPLPDQYRAFLRAQNGGRPRPNLIDIEGAHFKGTNISVFYAIDDSSESCDLLWNLEVLEGCKENKLLPMASDSFGNNYVLVIAEENYGEVYYFDAAEIPPRPYFIARDFNEFLGKIRDWTPEELAEMDARNRESSSDGG